MGVIRSGRTVRKTENPASKTYLMRDEHRLSNGTVQLGLDYNLPKDKFERSIAYTTKPPGQRDRSNQCAHQERVLGASVVTQSGAYAPNGGSYVYQSNSTQGYNSLGSVWNVVDTAYGKAAFGVIGSDGQGYVNDAFYTLKPDLTEISLPNFFFELGQIPSLFRLWSKKLSLARNVAGGRLNYSFGWLPFIGDLNTMVEIIQNVHFKLLEWNRKAGAVVKKSRHWSLDGSKSGSFSYPGNWTVYWTANRKAKVSVHLRFKTLRFKDSLTWQKVLKAYIDALGFEWNPRIVWDAIPFTFVVDWFFDAGGWIERHKHDTFELPVVVDDSCVQYKEEINISWYMENSNTNYTPRMRTQTFESRRKTFHRLPVMPDLTAATAAGWKSPNVNQLINLISLGTVLRPKI